MTNPKLDNLNALSQQQYLEQLQHICSSQRWQQLMLKQRPIRSMQQFKQVAEDAFKQLNEADWLEAFAGHPMIGDMSSLQKKYSQAKHLSQAEQAQVAEAQQDTLQQLLDLNHAYLERYGFIFIICASGKPAEVILQALQQRYGQSREQELSTAAEQQQQISFLRMEDLF